MEDDLKTIKTTETKSKSKQPKTTLVGVVLLSVKKTTTTTPGLITFYLYLYATRNNMEDYLNIFEMEENLNFLSK